MQNNSDLIIMAEIEYRTERAYESWHPVVRPERRRVLRRRRRNTLPTN